MLPTVIRRLAPLQPCMGWILSLRACLGSRLVQLRRIHGFQVDPACRQQLGSGCTRNSVCTLVLGVSGSRPDPGASIPEFCVFLVSRVSLPGQFPPTVPTDCAWVGAGVSDYVKPPVHAPFKAIVPLLEWGVRMTPHLLYANGTVHMHTKPSGDSCRPRLVLLVLLL